MHWELSDAQRDLLAFTRYVIHLRQSQPVLKRRWFFQGRSIRGGDVKDITWFEPGGREMSDKFWGSAHARSLGVRLVGSEISETDEQGHPIVGDTLFLMISAHDEPVDFLLPAHEPGQHWERLLDTSRSDWSLRVVWAPKLYRLAGRAVAVFRIAEPPAHPGVD
jgi:glycogen operon protein